MVTMINFTQTNRATTGPYPVIRKLGTILCDMVETTPVVFHDRLYRCCGNDQ